MLSIIMDVSKYIFALLSVCYAGMVLIGLANKNRFFAANIYALQLIITLAVHFLGYAVLFADSGNDIKYVTLYGAELVYFIVVYAVYGIFYKNASRLLVNNMCMLLAIGFIMITRLSYSKGLKQFIICAAATVVAFFIPAIIKRIKWLKNLSWMYCVAGLVLLVAVLFCTEVFGANLVLTIGGFSVQPSEFVKILFVMYVAAAFNKSTSFANTIAVTFFAAVHVVILVLSKDLGAALIFFVVYLMMMYTATGNVLLLMLGTGAGAVASVAAYHLFSHVRQRVLIWINPWADIDGKGYQICQSLFAIGMGSWFGYGLGQGLPGKIPVAEKDFMFSAITEEFGIFFAISLLFICLSNVIIMMDIASKCRTLFYRLVAVGLAVTYGFQVFLTVGGAMKLIPMTGVTLPLVSYGGSSLVSTLVMFALINGMYIKRETLPASNSKRSVLNTKHNEVNKNEPSRKKTGKEKNSRKRSVYDYDKEDF